MLFTVEVKEEEVQAAIEKLVAEKINKTMEDYIDSWEISQVVKEQVKSAIEKLLPAIIESKTASSNAELEKRVDVSLDTLIKSKVKKAMK